MHGNHITGTRSHLDLPGARHQQRISMPWVGDGELGRLAEDG